MSPRNDEAPVVLWGTASAALRGERESGDLALVHAFQEGALVAVIDGLGHGPEAALASRIAAQVIERHARDEPASIVERCHEALRGTRGAVMSLAAFNTRTSSLTWLGVGNVEGLLFRGAESEALALRGGVVGYRLPRLSCETLSVAYGDTVVLATDGLRGGFGSAVEIAQEPQAIAERLLASAAKGSDDACVGVARYVALPAMCVRIQDVSDIPVARGRLRDLAYRRGFQEVTVEALATAVSELAHNIVAHAQVGEIRIAFAEERGRHGLSVVARDDGPGIADLKQALEDGFSTKHGLGLGMSSAKRFADEFEVASEIGKGTTVTLKKWLP